MFYLVENTLDEPRIKIGKVRNWILDLKKKKKPNEPTGRIRPVRPPGRTGCPSGQTTQTEIRSVWLFSSEFGLDMNMKVVDNRTSFPMPPVLHQSDIGAISYVKNTKLKRFSTKPFIRVSV